MEVRIASWLLCLLLVLTPAAAVKRHDFKTCAQSGFCRRNRALADRANDAAGNSWTSPYTVSKPSFKKGIYQARIDNALYPNISFSLEVDFVQEEIARIKIDEVAGLRKRYDEAAQWALVSTPIINEASSAYDVSLTKDKSTIKYGNGKSHEVVIEHSPLRVTFSRDKQPYVVLNERGLFNMEHFRVKTPEAAKTEENEPDAIVQDGDSATDEGIVEVPVGGGKFAKFLDSSEEGMWTETFGGRTDSKPKGPEAVGLDISFPGYEHVFGIPEHSGPLALKTTRGGEGAYDEPYRHYNLDVFEYEYDSPMALYGAIPFMQAHRAGSSAGIFWLNGAETWIDIEKRSLGRTLRNKPESVTTHWFSESGILDLFIFAASNPAALMAQYSSLTGTTALPQYFAIGHHQCRWNYQSEQDVLEVSEKFDEADIPMDVIWLDIEYAEDKKYFIWDKRNFPTPEKMQQGLADRGRQLVAIIDPHIKRVNDLYVYKEAQELDILSKTPDGKEYEGWCWPGSSSWVDFFNPKSWDWWYGMFKFDKWKGSTRNLFIWNDMNEPSVFNGPEITMPKDNLHYGGWEHRDVHNINGMLYHNATAVALIRREDPPRRPFVLSRSFYAGSQRISAIWTGDNLGTWEHLQFTIPMVLANSVGGMAFSGGDVGGFFGNPDIDYLVRWYQAGCLAPFFRAHAHIDTKRREPYLFDQPHQGYIRDAIRTRYQLLPTLYTAFWHASKTGFPVAVPQYMIFPDDARGFTVDDQFWVGTSGLLVHPVVHKDAEEVEVYLAGEHPYYAHDNSVLPPNGKTTVPAPLGTLPLFVQGGNIVPRYEVIRRSAPLHLKDPISLTVALDATGKAASGRLYLDDGDTYSFEKGHFIDRNFVFGLSKDGKGLSLKNAAGSVSDAGYAASFTANIEKIEVLGLEQKPTCVKGSDGKPLAFAWQAGLSASAAKKKGGVGKKASILQIERAASPIAKEWVIEFFFDASSACEGPSTGLRPWYAELSSPQCPPNHFRCENKGHVPACILTSRVNDGICDEECCDGSDEFDGRTSCGDRCAAVGKAARAKADEEARKGRVGSKLRAEYAAFGAKERAALGARVAQHELALVTLEADEKRLRAVLESTEARQADDIEQKKSSPLYQRLTEYQAAIRSLRKQRSGLETDVGELSSLLTEMKSGYNPNNQDMAVKHAVIAFDEWQAKRGDSDPSEVDDSEQSAVATPAVNDDSASEEVPDEELESLENYDPLDLLDGFTEGRVGSASEGPSLLFRLEEYIPAAWRDGYDAAIDMFIGVLSSVGIVHPSSRRRSTEAASGERPDVARARQAHQGAEKYLNDEKRALEEAQSTLKKDWGRDWEWKKLDGTCLEKDTGEYTYEICLFQEGRQKANNGHQTTSLGRFSSWNTNAEAGTPEYYTKQVYTGGQRCWNGPERSVKLDIICGTSNALLSVIEPEKCEYLFKITSPAVCIAASAGQSGKSEL